MRRGYGAAALLAALGLWACGSDGGSGGGDGGVIAIGDATADASGPDAAPDENAALIAYCQARAENTCTWAFDCLGGGRETSISNVFRLGGPSMEDCIASVFEPCRDDLVERAERGVLSFNPEGGNNCATRLLSAPCPAGDPQQWAGGWFGYVDNNCGGVARGTVNSGDACNKQVDCAVAGEACFQGACGTVADDSLRVTCEPQRGTLWRSAPDDSCDTTTCLNLGTGGICSVADCTPAMCPGTAACIGLEIFPNYSRTFCILPCSREGDPVCGDLECRVFFGDPPESQKYCFPTPM